MECNGLLNYLMALPALQTVHTARSNYLQAFLFGECF